MRFFLHVLVNLITSVGFLACIYFFFHFETVSERLLYIGGTVALTCLLVYLVPKNKFRKRP